MSYDIELTPLRELDGRYVESQTWTRDLDENTLRSAEALVARMFNASDREIGVLAVDANDVILVVEVRPEHRRKGIATRLLAALVEAGRKPSHDWQNMSEDGRAWAGSAS